MPSKQKGKAFTSTLVVGTKYSTLILLSLIFLTPLLWAFLNSLKELSEITTISPSWVPNKLRWKNYLEVWNTGNFPRYYLNSVLVTSCQVVGTILAASLMAYPLARLRFKGRDALFLFVIAGMMISPEVLVIPRYLLVVNLKWVDTYQGLIVPGLFTPFACFVFRQFFLSIPIEIEEAAIIDGCSRFRIFWQIILPLSKPAIAVMAIFRFTTSWNELLWPVIVTNSDKLRVLTLGLAMFKNEALVQINLLLAACILATLPPIIVYVLFQKLFVKGFTLSGLKY